MDFLKIAISPEKHFSLEHKLVGSLVRSGYARFHVRKPHFSIEEMRTYIGLFDNHLRQYLVLHDHHELSEEMGLAGIHFNDRNPQRNDLKKGHLSWSKSCHSFEDLNTGYDLDYVFLSPIFNSISKPNYQSRFNPSYITEKLKQRTKRLPKIIALGGIDEDRLVVCEAMGFDGAAMLGAIWQQPNTLMV